MALDKYANLLRELNEDKEKESKLTSLNDRILVIDGLNTYIRCWSATPSLNEDGVHIGGIIGTLKSVAALIRQYKPTRCIIVFDGVDGNKRRRKLYPQYKEGRKFKINVKISQRCLQS